MPKRVPIARDINLNLRAAVYHCLQCAAKLGWTTAKECVSFDFSSCSFVELSLSLQLYWCWGRCWQGEVFGVALCGPSRLGGAASVQQPAMGTAACLYAQTH